MLRRFVLIYSAQHLEVGPGCPNGDTTQAPTETIFVEQITMASNPNGQTAAEGTPGYDRGPYMMRLPVNPLNGLDTIQVLSDGESFPAVADNSHGWIYKASTTEVRADNTGAGDNGRNYYDY